MSLSLESVRWNACVHSRDLGLYSHPKEFWGNGVRTHVNSKGKITSTGKKNLPRGGSNPRRCITQDSEPSTLPAELFRPQRYRFHCRFPRGSLHRVNTHQWGQPAIAAACCCRNPLLPQPAIAAINFDIFLEYLDKRTNEHGRLTTTGLRACLQCTGLRVPIPADVAKTSAGGRPFSLCKRFSRQ